MYIYGLTTLNTGGGRRICVFSGNGLKNISGDNLSVMHNSIISIFGGVSLQPLTQNKCGTLGVRYKLPNNDVRNFLENILTILANLKTLI